MLKPQICYSPDEPRGSDTGRVSNAIIDQLNITEDIKNRRKVWGSISHAKGIDVKSVEIGETIKILGVGEFKLNDERLIIECREDWSIFSRDPETKEIIEENITESSNAGSIPGAPSSKLWESFIDFVREIGQGDEGYVLVESFLNGVMQMKSRTDRGNWAHYASCTLDGNLVVAPDMLEGDLLFTDLLDNRERYNVRYIV